MAKKIANQGCGCMEFNSYKNKYIRNIRKLAVIHINNVYK